MNRDESRTRVAGLPPVRLVDRGRSVMQPHEPSGGTWISLNDVGVTFALINWYAIQARAPLPNRSRGELVCALRRCESVETAAEQLRQQSLAHTHPFRMIGFFPASRQLREWRWDLHELAAQDHEWTPQQWLSSGFDEPSAQRVRSATFTRFRAAPDAGTLAWLRRLHASHEPERGPFSTCMHRADAATVSYTEIEVTSAAAVMQYHVGSPCGGDEFQSETVPRYDCPEKRAVGEGA